MYGESSMGGVVEAAGPLGDGGVFHRGDYSAMWEHDICDAVKGGSG